jgi:hypothetical protein
MIEPAFGHSGEKAIEYFPLETEKSTKTNCLKAMAGFNRF